MGVGPLLYFVRVWRELFATVGHLLSLSVNYAFVPNTTFMAGKSAVTAYWAGQRYRGNERHAIRFDLD